jgi:hypothetical protein
VLLRLAMTHYSERRVKPMADRDAGDLVHRKQRDPALIQLALLALLAMLLLTTTAFLTCRAGS